jgi:hypothetical protein
MAVLAVVAALLLAGSADAQTFNTCSKNEGVAVSDQYCSPTVASNPGGGQMIGPPLARALPESVVEKLEDAGAAGKALLDQPRVAPQSVVMGQGGGRVKRVADAERLLALGALGTPVKPDSAARILAKTATLGEGFAKTFRWGLLVTTFLLVGASWLRYRARWSPTP